MFTHAGPEVEVVSNYSSKNTSTMSSTHSITCANDIHFLFIRENFGQEILTESLHINKFAKFFSL